VSGKVSGDRCRVVQSAFFWELVSLSVLVVLTFWSDYGLAFVAVAGIVVTLVVSAVLLLKRQGLWSLLSPLLAYGFAVIFAIMVNSTWREGGDPLRAILMYLYNAVLLSMVITLSYILLEQVACRDFLLRRGLSA